MKKRGVWEGLLVRLKMGFDAKYTSRWGRELVLFLKISTAGTVGP